MTDTKKTKSFSSDMPGAAVLSGTAGALIAVLDSVLVNGFGSVALTGLGVASGVATGTVASGHPFKAGSVALVTGATPSGLNGEKRILSVASNSVTFDATGISDGAATGTMSVKVAPAGWTKQFAGTNVAVYKMGGVEGTGFVLRVDDTDTTVARVRGYEVMSDANTGTGLFPTVAQWAGNGLWWSKSNAADITSRPWYIFADDRGVYFCPRPALAAKHQNNYFGDILSLKSGDAYGCALRANVENRSKATTAVGDDVGWVDNTGTQDGLYIARAANTLGGAARCFSAQVMGAGLSANSSYAAGSVGWQYPSPADNGLMLSPVAIYNAQGYRGYLPGVLMSPQVVNGSFGTGDIVPGSGDMAGRKLMAIAIGATSGAGAGTLFFDAVDAWRA